MNLESNHSEQDISTSEDLNNLDNHNQLDSSSTNYKSHLIKKDVPPSKIKERIIKSSKSKNTCICFETFESIQRNLEILSLLYNSNTPFQFKDFDKIKTRESLKLIIDYLEYTENNRSGKIKISLQKRKEKGESFGISSLSKSERQTILKGVRTARRVQIITDPTQIKIREIIRSNYEDNNLKFSEIARLLNEKGYRTSKKLNFQFTSVARLYKLVLELRKNFEIKNSAIELKCKNELLLKNKIEIKGFKNRDNFDSELRFNIISEINKSIIISIYNVSEKPIFGDPFKTTSKEICIPLLTSNLFIPGLYYIKLKSKGFDETVRSFYFCKKALPGSPKNSKKYKIGKNLDLSNLPSKEKKEKATSRAKIARNYNLIVDPTHFKLREEVRRLHDDKKLKLGQIAKLFNERGTKTINGGLFQQTTIKRLYKFVETLRENRQEDNNRMAVFAKMGKQPSQRTISIKGFKRNDNFTNEMNFTIVSRVSSPINLKISNVKNGVLYDEEIPSKAREIEIPLKQMNLFLPGLYYLHLEPTDSKYQTLIRPFYYQESFLPPPLKKT